MLVLSVVQGPDAGRRFELPDTEPQLIGRSGESLPLTDMTISRRHAELTPDNGIWYVRDLHSQNGTHINDVRITDRTPLRPGDLIRVGASVLRFGATEHDLGDDVVRLLDPDVMETDVEHVMPSGDDSILRAAREDAHTVAADHLRVIYRLTTLTTAALDRLELLRGVLELVFNEFKPERGFIMLGAGEGGESLRPAVVKYRTPPKDRDEAHIHVSQTILRHTLRKGQGILSTNAMNDPRFAAGDSVQRFHIRSAICAPIRFRDRTYGAVYIDSSIVPHSFTPEQLALLNVIGQHTALALANTDLYEQKLQTERLAAIGETVASLSHAIKNILQGLRGGADVVEMGLKKDDLAIAKGGWAILKRNLDRIVSLTLNMLAFSRQRTVELDLTRIGPMIDDCAQLLESQCNTRGVALIVDADAEMPPVPVDPPLMHQALMNLLGNAVEAVEPTKGVVTVRAHYHATGARGEGSPACVEIAVIDNGPGIPRDRQARIFEPFHTTKGSRGTGLGLAVTKRIVEEHGGRIRVESEVGQGAIFRVLLPADEAAHFDPSATAHSKPSATDLGAG